MKEIKTEVKQIHETLDAKIDRTENKMEHRFDKIEERLNDFQKDIKNETKMIMEFQLSKRN